MGPSKNDPTDRKTVPENYSPNLGDGIILSSTSRSSAPRGVCTEEKRARFAAPADRPLDGAAGIPLEVWRGLVRTCGELVCRPDSLEGQLRRHLGMSNSVWKEMDRRSLKCLFTHRPTNKASTSSKPQWNPVKRRSSSRPLCPR